MTPSDSAARRLRREVPVLVKIAPDLHDADVTAVARLAAEVGLAGVIATNTTISRPEELRAERAEIARIGAGGLSGPLLARRPPVQPYEPGSWGPDAAQELPGPVGWLTGGRS